MLIVMLVFGLLLFGGFIALSVRNRHTENELAALASKTVAASKAALARIDLRLSELHAQESILSDEGGIASVYRALKKEDFEISRDAAGELRIAKRNKREMEYGEAQSFKEFVVLDFSPEIGIQRSLESFFRTEVYSSTNPPISGQNCEEEFARQAS